MDFWQHSWIYYYTDSGACYPSQSYVDTDTFTKQDSAKLGLEEEEEERIMSSLFLDGVHWQMDRFLITINNLEDGRNICGARVLPKLSMLSGSRQCIRSYRLCYNLFKSSGREYTPRVLFFPLLIVHHSHDFILCVARIAAFSLHRGLDVVSARHALSQYRGKLLLSRLYPTLEAAHTDDEEAELLAVHVKHLPPGALGHRSTEIARRIVYRRRGQCVRLVCEV